MKIQKFLSKVVGFQAQTLIRYLTNWVIFSLCFWEKQTRTQNGWNFQKSDFIDKVFSSVASLAQFTVGWNDNVYPKRKLAHQNEKIYDSFDNGQIFWTVLTDSTLSFLDIANIVLYLGSLYDSEKLLVISSGHTLCNRWIYFLGISHELGCQWVKERCEQTSK